MPQLIQESASVAHIVGGIMALLLITALIHAFTKRIRLPLSVVLVLVGMWLHWLSGQYPQALTLPGHIELSSDLVLYVFLPTLVFESAYNMDSRLLRHNIGPVLLLAVPGLLLSTAVIGGLLSLVTPIPLAQALLLGAILSATDPVAVIALFKRLGAPQRLTVLVEGESLLNDATALVLSKILIGVVLAGNLGWDTVGDGIGEFFRLFLGGYLVGWLLARTTGSLLGYVRSDSFLEITLTLLLAYGAFLIAEELLHLSGVMATLAAGLTLGGWGRLKISPPVREYLEHFWEYMAFLANALVFLLVGLRVDLQSLLGVAPLLGWTLLAMLLARAAVVYGMMPLAKRIPGSDPVNYAYQTVMVWGGLRGAIALAIVMSLPLSDESFTAIVMGAVLFTLLVQGLTMQPLVHWLGLDRPPLASRLALAEVELTAHRRALARLPELVKGGLFSQPIAHHLQQICDSRLAEAQRTMDALRHGELDHQQELRLLYLRAFAEEKAIYNEMYSRGQLSEGAFRELAQVLDMQIDALRYHGRFEHVHSHRLRRFIEKYAYRWLLDRFRILAPLAERLRLERISRDYEEILGHYQANEELLRYLDGLAELEDIPEQLVEEVRGRYRHWHQLSRHKLDQAAEQFPEFVNAMQEHLGMRMLLLAESESAREKVLHGTLPGSLAEQLEERIAAQIEALRNNPPKRFEDDPEDLLRELPLLLGLNDAEYRSLSRRLTRLTRNEGEVVIHEGEGGDALFLIARGVLSVERVGPDGKNERLGTLLAGHLFGESSLLHEKPRNATVRCMSPCLLYEVPRHDLQALIRTHPEIHQRLEDSEEKRNHNKTAEAAATP